MGRDKFVSLLLNSLIFVACAVSTNLTHDLVPFSKLTTLPPGWTRTGVPITIESTQFRIAINNGQESEFEQHVIALSTPGSPTYGQRMSIQEIKDVFRPSPNVTAAIFEWLQVSGVHPENITDDGNWILFNATFKAVGQMLKTQFFQFKHDTSDLPAIRTTEYSVPASLRRSIKLILPTLQFDIPLPQRTTASTANLESITKSAISDHGTGALPCDGTITPSCLKNLYQISDYTANATKGRIGISGFSGIMNKTDFQLFNRKYAPHAVMQDIHVVELAPVSLGRNIEADLDVQYSYPISYPTPAYFYVGGGAFLTVPFVEFLESLLQLPQDELPHTLSNSYGVPERYVDQDYAQLTCSLIAQLAARGVSFIDASGDDGPGLNCRNGNILQFAPAFPGSCPFVTSVGGTHHVSPEEAVEFSSGGFSNYFPRLPYQDTAVERYLKGLGDKFDGYFNPDGRGFPDVAAQAENFLTVINGEDRLASGTSGSAPVFAAIVALVNEARLARGQSTLGFLNPFLYDPATAKAFTDITEGRSEGCFKDGDPSSRGPRDIPEAGWDAVPGWDPATGLGTPIFPQLLSLATASFGSAS